MNYNPIYDEETSEFLGTDDKGLQGDAIIMNKKDFTQGMAHDDAMKVGNTLDNMSFDDALAFAGEHGPCSEISIKSTNFYIFVK